MGTKCFRDIQINDCQCMINSPRSGNFRTELPQGKDAKEYISTVDFYQNGQASTLSPQQKKPVNLSKDSTQNIPLNVPHYIPHYITQNIPQNMPLNVPENDSQNMPRKISQNNIPKNISQNSLKNISQNSLKNISQNSPQNIQKNISQNSLNIISQNSQNNIPQNILKNISQNSLKNISQNSPRNIEEDACYIERKLSKKPQRPQKMENDEAYEKNILEVIQKQNQKNDDFQLIDTCLMKHFFMQSLEKEARKEIIQEMSLCTIKPNQFIFKQGGMGIYFYILKKGIVERSVDGKLVRNIKVGESFGELALLHGAPRASSTKAVTQCHLWVLERKNFRKIVDHITKLNFEENKNFIESVPILSIIDNCQKTILCSSLYKEIFEEGHVIVKQGALADCLYIIKEGEVNCQTNGKVVRVLKKGTNFGERSILVDSTRTLDVIAKTKCICYSVAINTLKTMLGENYRKVLYLNFIKTSFSMSKVFNKLNVSLLDEAFDFFIPLNLKSGEIAYPSGYIPSQKIVVVIDGALINGTTNEIIANRGEILFESNLLKNSKKPIDYNILPRPDCLLVEAETAKVVEILGISLHQLIDKSHLIESLSKVSILKNLSKQQLQNLSQKIGEETYENGTNIVSKGENGTKFYIVKSGKVDIIVNNQYLRTLNEKEYFGERALFFHEKRSATAKAKGKVEVFYLDKEDFLSIIASNMKEHLIKRLSLQDNTVELNDLEYCDKLGSGNYGQVSLVMNKKNQFLYAIKGIAKKQIDFEQLHKNLELEKSILLQIDHPFIVKLVKTLKDKNTIYFLMEYIKGKELFDVIRDIGLLNKSQTQFYGASMILAVNYLHLRQFVFRDIKPENVLIIESGYIKLIDFGTAKSIVDRASTIIGTPHYMAPEVILGEGYSFQVDVWSIAICMFEFMCGGVPFGESCEDPMEVYMTIINE